MGGSITQIVYGKVTKAINAGVGREVSIGRMVR